MSDPFRQTSTRRLPPFPGNQSKVSLNNNLAFLVGRSSEVEIDGGDESTGFTPDFVKTYLSSHVEILDEYVMEAVGYDQLEEWMQKKKQNHNATQSLDSLIVSKTPLLQGRYLVKQPCRVQRDLLEEIYSKTDHWTLLYELANVIGTAIKSDSCTLYVPTAGGNELHYYISPKDGSNYQLKISGRVGLGSTVSAHVASTKQTVVVKDLLEDERFPRGIGLENGLTHCVLCVPVTLPNEDLHCVMEFIRKWDKPQFEDAELQSATAIVSWIGAMLYQCQANKVLSQQADLNDFLLDVTKNMFDDIIEIESLAAKIMIYTKDLVQADRCALFLVDKERQELYSCLLDEGEVTEDGKPVFTKRDIRFSIDRGIAGSVATTGKLINIPDAYNDPRFNREIDQQTGYTSRAILCMPIISKGQIIGVVQVINKKGQPGHFTKSDESAFKMFAVYSAVALHYSQVNCELKCVFLTASTGELRYRRLGLLYDLIVDIEDDIIQIYQNLTLHQAQYKVALEQVNYHSQCSEDEYRQFRRKPILPAADIPPDFDSYTYYGPSTHEDYLPHLLIHMLHNLFGSKSFDLDTLCRFTLTVRKNYRPVPYHNWMHGWNVAHCVYAVLLRIKPRNIISELWMKALVIAALCHDLDHRGLNNAFFTKFNEPLATLYPSSVMEQHHFVTTIQILQQDRHDIFSSLNPEDYKTVLGYIRRAIIDTDLSLFFGKQKLLSEWLNNKTFDLNNQQHLLNATGVLMTAADLCAVCKPWPVQQGMVQFIYEEFYFQGDIEKSQGVEPMCMMDRCKMDDMPKDQVGFIKFVCIPCYKTLSDIFPETSPLLAGCADNLSQWERVVEGKSTTLWEPAKSRVNVS